MLPRRTWLEVQIDGVDISEAVAAHILDFTYTDKASGESDSVDLTLHDRDGLFIDSWYPMEGISSGDGEMASALQRGVSTAELQRLIDKSGMTPEQGAKLQAMTDSSKWPQFVAEHPEYRGESGKQKLIEDVKGDSGSGGGGGSGAITFKAIIHVENWDSEGDNRELDCGKFKIDSCVLNGPPDIFSIKAVSIPVSSSLKVEQKTHNWEETTLKEIAQSIADNSEVQLMYEVEDDIQLDRVDQIEQSDMAFLLELCNSYGVSLKATDDKIVLFEESVYEQKATVETFDKSEVGGRVIDYSFTQDTSGTVSSSELNYKDPKSGKLVQAEFTPPNPPPTGQRIVTNERPGDLKGDGFRDITG